MKYLKKFNENSESNLEFDCLYSRNGVYLYQFDGFNTFERFVNSHSEIFKGVMWAINPLVNTRNADHYFNMYKERFPIFTIIIDINNRGIKNYPSHSTIVSPYRVIGVSLDKSGQVGASVDETDNQVDISIFDDYLKKLHITREDLS